MHERSFSPLLFISEKYLRMKNIPFVTEVREKRSPHSTNIPRKHSSAPAENGRNSSVISLIIAVTRRRRQEKRTEKHWPHYYSYHELLSFRRLSLLWILINNVTCCATCREPIDGTLTGNQWQPLQKLTKKRNPKKLRDSLQNS